jgi:hypothetical protein
MADLFASLPKDVFQPLAAPGAGIYSHILLSLFAETQRHQDPLSRERALGVVLSVLAEHPDQLALTGDAVAAADAVADAAGDAAEETTGSAAWEADAAATAALSIRAGAILRYLERCGWLRGETQSDFSQHYILPDYAFRLLRVLAEIAVDEPPPLAGLVYTIHSVAQETLRSGGADFGIPEAYRHTEHLVNGLKELHHNIGAHVNRVLRQLAASEVLAQFFTAYQAEVVDRAYHQLRTTDHVSRYRPGVLEAVRRLNTPERIEEAARRQFERREAAGVDAAAERLREQLAYIHDQFEALDSQLQAIDARHNQFVHAAVRAVELHLAAHTTTSGQLADIIRRVLADGGGAQMDMARDAMGLYRLELPDGDSLAPPARAGRPFEPELENAPALSEDEVEDARDLVLRQLGKVVSRERVRRFAEQLLEGRDALDASDIPMRGPDDLPLLIYLRAYGDGTLGYRVVEREGWVESGQFAFRDFRLAKTAGN